VRLMLSWMRSVEYYIAKNKYQVSGRVCGIMLQSNRSTVFIGILGFALCACGLFVDAAQEATTDAADQQSRGDDAEKAEEKVEKPEAAAAEEKGGKETDKQAEGDKSEATTEDADVQEEKADEEDSLFPVGLDQEGGKQSKTDSKSVGGSGWMGRYLFGMVVVVGVMALVLYGLRTLRTRLTRGTVAEQGVRILGKFPLDRRNNIVLVRIQDEDLLISSGNEGAQLLARYRSKDKSDQDASSGTEDDRSSFHAEVSRNIKGRVD